MSLIPFDDLLFPERRCFSVWPSYHSRPLVSSVLNEGFRELQQLERELGQLMSGVDAKDGGLTFRCNVAGYRPEELKVDVEGNQLVIAGEHKDSSEGQTVHRTFVRRVTIPDTIKKDTIQCNLDEKGRLEVTAQRHDAPESQKQSIPIGFKQSTPAVEQQKKDSKKK